MSHMLNQIVLLSQRVSVKCEDLIQMKTNSTFIHAFVTRHIRPLLTFKDLLVGVPGIVFALCQ
jgi:hypothetical protein